MSATVTAERNCEHALFVRLPPFLGYKSHHPRDITLPFTIAYSATMVQETGRKATVFDLWAHEEKTLQECLDDIQAANPDVIFFECTAAATPIILKCAERVRSFSDARFVAFGSGSRMIGGGATTTRFGSPTTSSRRIGRTAPVTPRPIVRRAESAR